MFMRKWMLAFVILPVVLFTISCQKSNAAQPVPVREPVTVEKGKEVAIVAGGCFWCTEAVFKELRGVEKVESGYTGGTVDNPTYEQVTTGDTNHAEAIRITYDPKQISYQELLEVFFVIHDPTTLNRQGADRGTQYRSSIFYHSPEQKKIAEQVIKNFTDKKVYEDAIVTKLESFTKFYIAEEYHQNYFERNPDKAYCRIVIQPKVLKFRKEFLSKLKNKEQAN
jgi:peptide-methionine (S)-S-oxide reductase